MKRFGFTMGVVVVLLLANPFFTNLNSSNAITLNVTPIDLIEPPLFVINSTIPINIVFIGFDESNIDTVQIDQGLTHWYAPLITQGSSYPYLGANYTLDVNYHYSNATTLEDDYITYLASIVSYNSTPIDALTNYNPSASTAALFPAVDAMTWLDNNINSYFPGANNSYTMYLIDTNTWGYIIDYYYYTLDYLDPDTGQPTLNPYTILYGGDWPNRGLLMDLSAGPMEYEESLITEANEGVSATTIEPIWTYSFPTDKVRFNDNVTEYIQETIDLVFTPSYIYDPIIRENFEIQIYMFDDATTSQVNQIDAQVILDEYTWLFPTLNVTVTLTVDTMANFPDLATVMSNAIYIGPTGKDVIDSIPVRDYLMQNLGLFGMDSNTLPVFIWVWDDPILWMSGELVLGVGIDDGAGNPAMVLMGYDPVNGNSNEGYTVTTIHEVGHLIGLRHPHDGWSWNDWLSGGTGDLFDWLRDFVSTPMTYASVDTTFSTFDVDTMDRGFAINRIKDKWDNLYEANLTLLNHGYSTWDRVTNKDPQMVEYLDWSVQNASMALNSFEAEDFFSAFNYANLSSFASELYLDGAILLGPYTETTTEISIETTTKTTTENISITEIISSNVTKTVSITGQSTELVTTMIESKTETKTETEPASILIIPVLFSIGIIVFVNRRGKEI